MDDYGAKSKPMFTITGNTKLADSINFGISSKPTTPGEGAMRSKLPQNMISGSVDVNNVILDRPNRTAGQRVRQHKLDSQMKMQNILSESKLNADNDEF